METGYKLHSRGSIPGIVSYYTAVLRPTQPPIQGITKGFFSLGVKQPVFIADHSSPSSSSSTELKNDGAIPPFPHTKLCADKSI
jgi:hypothetical protein